MHSEQKHDDKDTAATKDPYAKFPGFVVADVPELPAGEVDAFRAKYINNDKVPEEDPRNAELVARDVEIQFARWGWVQENTSTYVNMLRISGHSDVNIQACFDGVRPLGYEEAPYEAFKASLRKLAADIERDTGWKRVRFAQTGSAVAGYSSNPVKGFEKQPSKIHSLASSDVDLYAIAEGISEWVDKCKADGKPYPDKEYQTTTTLGGKYDVNYSVPNLADASPALAAWHSEWSAHFGGGIQFTLRRMANPTIVPWDGLVRL